HGSGGCNACIMDGGVEFTKYPGRVFRDLRCRAHRSTSQLGIDMRNLPVVLLVLLLMPVPAHAQSPGDAPPKRAQQRLRALALSLESALNARDRTAIDNGVTQMRAILGPFAGIPESPEKYHVPVNDTQPD